jgi:glucokinase
MTHLLAADIGGTKTLCQLADEHGRVRLQQRFLSQDFDNFEQLLEVFLKQPEAQGVAISSACIAVAGPVDGDSGRVTKLPWQLHAAALAERFQIKHLQLCNDFEAIGHGIAALELDELETLQVGEPNPTKPRAVIGAGTGLGQAILVPENGDWRVLATEGGHVDFAPQTTTQQLLLEQVQKRYGHVSYDRLVCGKGLETMYLFLRDYRQIKENPELRIAMLHGDPAAAISDYAVNHNDPLSNQALDLFVSIYGAQAGNLALSVMARGGIYLAGGIVAKNIAKFREADFLEAFTAKGRMQDLMEKMPVHVVLDTDVGLKGAHLLARKAMYN